LLVALHSHAFIFMSILVLLLIGALNAWASGIAWLETLFAVLTAAAWIWIFLYLLLMQKRVYRQGWFMTTFKFCLVGFCYLFLLGFGLAGAVIASLTIV
jgi:hypothetical protein